MCTVKEGNRKQTQEKNEIKAETDRHGQSECEAEGGGKLVFDLSGVGQLHSHICYHVNT